MYVRNVETRYAITSTAASATFRSLKLPRQLELISIITSTTTLSIAANNTIASTTSLHQCVCPL